MHPIIAELISAGPVITDGAWGTNTAVITDGAWGTQLQLRGMPLGSTPDTWNLDHPKEVEDVARAYVEAGSQIILTNTFCSNRFILGRHGLADKVGRYQSHRRGNFQKGRPRQGQGLRFDRAQRSNAFDGRREHG